FQAEDGIRDFHVTGVQTCALPISSRFNANRILEKIIDPNRVVADQYLSSEVRLTNGQVLMGLPVESGDTVTVHPRDPQQQATTVDRKSVVEGRKVNRGCSRIVKNV